MNPGLKEDVRRLTTWLGDTLREAEGDAFYRLVEKVRRYGKSRNGAGHPPRRLDHLLSHQSVQTRRQLARAFTLYFHLVNLAEENYRIERIRSYERDGQPPEPLSMKDTLRRLRLAGVPDARMKEALAKWSVEPVLTAHPTEAKRRTVLRHLLAAGDLFRAWHTAGEGTWARLRLEGRLREVLEVLWQTKLIRDRRVTVEDELSTVLFFFQRTVFDAFSDFQKTVDEAFQAFYPTVRPGPVFRFGSWVGGDRDGNPHVTTRMGEVALAAHRRRGQGDCRDRHGDPRRHDGR